jgi:hypothetical protein
LTFAPGESAAELAARFAKKSTLTLAHHIRETSYDNTPLPFASAALCPSLVPLRIPFVFASLAVEHPARFWVFILAATRYIRFVVF